MLHTYLSLLVGVVLLSLLFHGLERLIPAERGQPLSAWLANLAYAPFFLLITLAVGYAFLPVIAAILAQTGGGLLPVLVGPDSHWTAHLAFAFAYAFVWDLSQYAMHRLQHAVPVLWETHRFHHDETALSAAAQTRAHWTSYVLALIFHMPIIALVGPQAPHFLMTFAMFRLWGFVNHANVRLGLGPLAPCIAFPQWHRIHHSMLAEHRDRNFATFFPVIDMIFGTYYRPKPGEYPATGIAETRQPMLQAATIGPLLAWRDMLRRRLATGADERR